MKKVSSYIYYQKSGRLMIGLAVAIGCTIIILSTAIQAYLARSIILWGKIFLLLALCILTGVISSLYLIFRPKISIWFRLAGIITLSLLVEGVMIFLIAAERAPIPKRPAELKAICLYNMKKIANAISLYSDENGHFPATKLWLQAAEQTDRQIRNYLKCPSSQKLQLGYTYNIVLGSINNNDVVPADKIIMLFESDDGKFLPDEPRHLGGDNYAFVDGHVFWLPRKKLPDGSWAKEPDANWVRWLPVMNKNDENTNE